jgi:YHS domain-containing protein
MSAADKAMGGLDAADQAIAKAQGTCPVSGEALGSMGTPVKKMVGDKAVFLCCPSCEKKFDADPQKYLAMTPQGKK